MSHPRCPLKATRIVTTPVAKHVDSSCNAANHGDLLSTLLGSLDVECSTVDAIGIARTKGEFTVDFGPVVYVVLEGNCRFQCPGAKPIELGRGDIVALCEGGKHGLSHISASPSPQSGGTCEQRLPVMSAVGGCDQTLLVRVLLEHSSPRVHPLWYGLPNPVHMRNVVDGQSDPILGSTIRSMWHLLSERRDGSNAIMRSLGRVLVLEIIRKTIAWPELAGSRFARSLRDTQLASVLAQVYRDPTQPWTLAALANEAGISRSSLVRRFKQLMEMSFTEWMVDLRMRLAQGLLADPNAGLGQVARKVGYSNAASFSVAFKRWAGHYPSFGRGRSSPKDKSRLTSPPE